MTNGYSDYLQHHGVKGMHWGVRRYQNYDGTIIRTGEKGEIQKKRIDELNKSNDRISKNYHRNPSAKNTAKYLGNKYTQLTMNRNDRARMMSTLNDPKKSKIRKVGSAVGNYTWSIAKQTAALSIPQVPGQVMIMGAIAMSNPALMSIAIPTAVAGANITRLASYGNRGLKYVNTSKNR